MMASIQGERGIVNREETLTAKHAKDAKKTFKNFANLALFAVNIF